MIRIRGGFVALLLATSALATPLPAPKGAEFEAGFPRIRVRWTWS